MGASMRVGFVGMGKIGRIRLEEVHRFPDIEPIGFVDPGSISAPEGIARFESPASMIAEGRPDAVFICVPNVFTASLTEQFLRSGIGVFAEKPPARRLKELLPLQAIVERSAAPALMYGFNHRHKAGVRALLDRVESYELGRLSWLRGRYGKEIEDDFWANWRSNYSLSGGGILLDQGIHLVDLMREIAGGFDEVSSAISNHVTGRDGIEDNAFVIFRSGITGVTASLHSTMTQWRYLFSLEVFFEKGSMILNGLRTPSGNYGSEVLSIHSRRDNGIHDNFEETFDQEDDNSGATEIAIFLDSLRNKEQPPVGNLYEAIQTLRLVEMAYDADPTFSRPEN